MISAIVLPVSLRCNLSALARAVIVAGSGLALILAGPALPV